MKSGGIELERAQLSLAGSERWISPIAQQFADLFREERERASLRRHPLVDAVDLSLFPIPIVLEIRESLTASVLRRHGVASGELVVHATAIVIDVESGLPTTVIGTDRIPEHVTNNEREAVACIYRVCRSLVLHELDECFLLNGKPFKNPHPPGPQHAEDD